jgi:GTP-binding protein
VAEILRRSQKKLEDGTFWPPIYLVVNKCENEARRAAAIEFYELGLDEPFPISAMHGTNVGDLLDMVVANFPETESEADDSIKIAIVGKPNAGKSSLLNKLAGEERSIVSPIAGTTRDAVDSKLEYEDIPLTLIDTAGIRKRGKIDPGVERYSVVRAKKAIERADVALLMVDAETGITAQDLHIAGFILDEWKSTVVLVNKWDAIAKDSYTMNYYTEKILHELNFMPYVPLLFISATTGQRVDKVLPLALKVQEARLTRISTSQLNKILRDALDAHPAPSQAGRQLKIYYATQVRSDPPTFLVYVNDPKLMHFSYKRFLENRIRDAHEFLGTPIRIVLKGKEKKGK